MSTKALDLVTMGSALDELSRAFLGDCHWWDVNFDQRKFLEWYDPRRDALNQLSGLENLASLDYLALNEFLVSRGFEPQFDEFDGIGVVSILDMLVEWLAKGELTSIRKFDTSTSQYVTYPAFRILGAGCDIFDVGGFSQPLVRLRTASGHGFWLMKADEPVSGLDLALTAQKILTRNRTANPKWTVGAKIPMLEIDVQPDLSWMLGMNTHSPLNGYHQIAQAFQQFKLRANEKGARVKVATGFGTTRGGSFGPVPYALDEPFIGFFTQPGHDELSMAAFWADTDSWRSPEGSLEEL